MESISIAHWIVIILFVAIYFLPAIVARKRHHRQTLAIFILNLLLGWTLLGWVIAMVWACTADTLPEDTHVLSLGGEIVVSIIGAFGALWLLPGLGIHIGTGLIAQVIVAVIGAGILLLVVRPFTKRRQTIKLPSRHGS